MKKILKIIGGICGVLLAAVLIFIVIQAAKEYKDAGNLLILYTDSDITAALESTGIPHSAEETAMQTDTLRNRSCTERTAQTVPAHTRMFFATASFQCRRSFLMRIATWSTS